jgi:hypothetical protein
LGGTSWSFLHVRAIAARDALVDRAGGPIDRVQGEERYRAMLIVKTAARASGGRAAAKRDIESIDSAATCRYAGRARAPPSNAARACSPRTMRYGVATRSRVYNTRARTGQKRSTAPSRRRKEGGREVEKEKKRVWRGTADGGTSLLAPADGAALSKTPLSLFTHKQQDITQPCRPPPPSSSSWA